MNSTIIEEINIHSGSEVIGKTILFDDDTSVSISLEDNSVIDLSGMAELPNDKRDAIEERLSILIF